MRVRRARRQDARAIAELHVRAWRSAYRGLVPDELLDALSIEERERAWTEVLGGTDGSSFTLVAVGGDGRVVGFCTARTPSRDDDASEGTAEVAATYVDPGHWRAGVGGSLLQSTLAELRRAGFRDATLWVFADNDSARAFYRAFGFEPDGRERRADRRARQLEVRLRVRIAG
jgi:ribosomal protein S18 acetylase RimI-like enzyme